MPGIFISYRRADSQGFAGSLLRDLNARLPTHEVFMDIEDIAGGVDYTVAIDRALNSSHVFIALIGERWLDITDKAGNRRLDNPDDWVRIEVATALRTGMRVIPLLVKGTRMPRAEALPEGLEELSKRNAMEISNEDWDHDVDKLCAVIREAIGLVDVDVAGQQHTVQVHQLREERPVATCDGCGVRIHASAPSPSPTCPVCGGQLGPVQTVDRLRPAAEIAFAIDPARARQALSEWVGGRWLAPGDWKRLVRADETLSAVLLPYWRFGCDTEGTYKGRRGVSIELPDVIEIERDGKIETRNTTRTETTWSAASGSFQHSFDDLLIADSRTLPADALRCLEPWDMEELTRYGASARGDALELIFEEDLPQAYGRAIDRIGGAIDDLVQSHIGGDEQEIDSVSVRFANGRAETVLLPVYLGSFLYGEEPYRVMVNARTGEVQGEAPSSLAKRVLFGALAVLLLASIVAGVLMIAG